MDHPQRPVLALVLRLAGAAAFAAMAMLIKLAGDSGANLPEIMFWRQIVPVALILGYVAFYGGIARLRTERLAGHGMRSLTGMVGMVCGFTGMILLPLAESTTLGFTTPIFTVLLSAMWFREAVGPWRWVAVIAGLCGVAIIAQPGIAPISAIGAMATLTGALLTAIVSYMIRDLGRTEEPIRTVFYFSLFGSILMAGFLPFYSQPHSAWQWLLLLSIGVCGTFGQLLLTASLRLGAVTSVVVMDYSSLIWASLFGWLIWNQYPSAQTWIGAPLIITAGIVIAWREHRLGRSAPTPAAIELD
jgi:drug/metabolite transporter (DMT)-like permease